MKLGQKISQIIPFLLRNLVARQSRTFERILKHIKARGDIWTVSQGEYISWWMKRENASLKITVFEGRFQVYTSLENAVIEKFPGKFLDSPNVPCKNTKYFGEVWITVDNTLEKKELLIELLKREGIFNFRIAGEGEFMLSREDVGALLDEIEVGLIEHRALYENNVRAIRQIVIDKLAERNLPLLRIWYHPRLNDGTVIQAVFSPRYDVDRAITNLAGIRALENKYDVSSTQYLRIFCPFYTDSAIKELVARPWCSEIALHGEFVTHARKFGDEYKAAVAGKVYLEKLTGRSVLGVAMHGGELSHNQSNETNSVIQEAKFLYYTASMAKKRYYFPFKRILNEQISKFYVIPCVLSDFGLFPFKNTRKVVNGKVRRSHSFLDTLKQIKDTSFRNYNQLFYKKTIAKMDEVYLQNGIFVILLHPGYFGFFSYLSHPKNWPPLFKFLVNYFRRSSGY
jgi:hypothetical protein